MQGCGWLGAYYVITSSSLYVFLIGAGLFFIYLAVIYVQFKTPLVNIEKNIITVSNFFYTGVITKRIDRVSSVQIDKNITINLYGENPVEINLLGMNKHKIERSISEIAHFFPQV
jgi:hypothetical protein